ncbi:uncharacterized protein N0V89_005012 [Didymosphaeria variabile]|uniref:Beta-galactosidase n=1 Tax=Didymosphaeria variabile TaxID=1932322 RepID=A0A9W9CAV7_9PLEO|nr:uncharacterized protein N0V89_005012 [Didymosphaeria variabile]KAJ4353285.1 hypothetical protein N0V89_005012 [Didymosphaeria variabile]
MKHILKGVSAVALACLTAVAHGRAVGYRSPTEFIKPYKRQALQDVVTWDKDTIFINGERLFLYSGEVHPFRLPVPDLHLDVFQKIKAIGYNGVSFYIDWALLEGKPGEYREEGVFDLKPFFDAASEAGIYLIARPGPYINAEVSGGGYPGWIQRVKGTLRTRAEDYLNATDNYMANVGKTLAAAQITNGGPLVLVQPENEYTSSTVEPFPDGYYMQYVEDQLRNAGIVVPLISNDASNSGHNVPGSGEGAVDIYGHDGYPVGFDCSNPEVWGDQQLVTNYYDVHMQQSPNTPYSIMEFQGGSYDPWGGPGFDKCLQLVNAAFERVFYKNIYSFGVTIFNIYMTYGGTNWGNLGHPGDYTSYDYAAIIAEDRQVNREKYSEQKLQANFFKVSPAYLTASRGSLSTTQWTNNPEITVTDATNNSTKFYFTRHTTYNTLDSTSYKLTIPTTAFGNITVPQYNGSDSLSLNGRDTKIHVSDYDIGGTNLIYSTAEIFTWHKYDDRTVLVVYGGPGETHELAIAATGLDVLEGDVKSTSTKGYTLLNFKADGPRKVAKVGVDSDFIYVYMLDRNSAYNYWSIDQEPHSNADAIILKAGYLMRTANVDGTTLDLTGDVNATTPIEILGGAPSDLSKLTFNGNELSFNTTDEGVVNSNIAFSPPTLNIPDLSSLEWKYIDSLPEIQSSYDDSAWKDADLEETYNSYRSLNTPTSLYGSDYGFNTGMLLFRGHFTASGAEKTFFIDTQGGAAYASSVWLDSTFLGSFRGAKGVDFANSTFTLPSLTGNKTYVLTVLVDNQGLDETWTIGEDTSKNPRGIMDYDLDAHDKEDVSWKLTGNLGGEDYVDKTRGPLNEGGLFVERNGLHLPGALDSDASWTNSSGPVESGIAKPGVGFFGAEFELDIPGGWDVPLSFTFTNSTTTAHRVLLYVNGWQYGKYVNNIGPQTVFPVPQGILDYNGTNYLGVAVWGLDEGETKLGGLELGADAIIASGMGEVGNVDGSTYEEREGAY